MTGIGLGKHLWPQRLFNQFSRLSWLQSRRRSDHSIFGSKRLFQPPSVTSSGQEQFGIMHCVFSPGQGPPLRDSGRLGKRMEIWSQSRRQKNARLGCRAHDRLCARNPAAPGRAAASGSLEEAEIPGARRGRAEGGHRSDVTSLQVSAGGGDEVAQGRHSQVTKRAALNSNKLVTFSGCMTLSAWLDRSAPQFPRL